MTKHTTNGFTPGTCYDRDGTLMVEVKPGIFVNETTARVKHGVVPSFEGKKDSGVTQRQSG